MLKKLLATVAVAAAFAGSAQAQTQDGHKKPGESLYIANYDFEQKEYNKCLEGIVANTPGEYIACLNAEIKRQNSAIAYNYTQLLKLPEYQKWNNGNDMFRGNMKDMNDQYIAYRERICSMYGLAYENLLNTPEHGRKKCTMEINDMYLRRLQEIYGTSISDFSGFDDFEPGTI